MLDAAMGTRLIARGLDLAADDPCLWALDRPEDVLDIHRRDIEAGADALLTDTFGASRRWLARFGRADDAPAINRRAVALAREAAGPDRFVLGSIGPHAAHDRADTTEQALALAEAGVDALILETHRPSAYRHRTHWLREVIELPILVSVTPGEDQVRARRGRSPGQPWSEAWVWDELGLAAFGCNCLGGMSATARYLRQIRGRSRLPLLAMPSAGLPGEEPAGPESFAVGVPRLLALGVRLFGGCCGTTEAHVAALRAAVDGVAGPGQRDRHRAARD